ncbi:DUF488 domain-containing protein [Breznakiella homolactica]|uniref:DUF488 domain-containing protein n=1 Tax=Breznakiella homolactica TaxID=2798577 RepID=A0A7T7XMP4_9SPIR|nr:DUF488 domain-containing protein [Breznakiella homolactica]QQO09058.1 DUF488 domain-containing protein [Breznakiella homolactica]
MTRIAVKRVYETAEESDGFRVLVDRLWPRGIKKENLRFSLWAKEISPSTELREWVHGDPEKRWAEFTGKYRQELDSSPDFGDFLEKIKSKPMVTLLYAARDETQNHALILKQYIEEKLS